MNRLRAVAFFFPMIKIILLRAVQKSICTAFSFARNLQEAAGRRVTESDTKNFFKISIKGLQLSLHNDIIKTVKRYTTTLKMVKNLNR